MIRNGIEAIVGAGKDSGTVTVSLHREGDMAMITVEDTGPGISEEDLRNIFQPFFSSKSDGLGMGLRISRSLAEANGGRLWARAHAPGAIFHVLLPLAA